MIKVCVLRLTYFENYFQRFDVMFFNCFKKTIFVKEKRIEKE